MRGTVVFCAILAISQAGVVPEVQPRSDSTASKPESLKTDENYIYPLVSPFVQNVGGPLAVTYTIPAVSSHAPAVSKDEPEKASDDQVPPLQADKPQVPTVPIFAPHVPSVPLHYATLPPVHPQIYPVQVPYHHAVPFAPQQNVTGPEKQTVSVPIVSSPFLPSPGLFSNTVFGPIYGVSPVLIPQSPSVSSDKPASDSASVASDDDENTVPDSYDEDVAVEEA